MLVAGTKEQMSRICSEPGWLSLPPLPASEHLQSPWSEDSDPILLQGEQLARHDMRMGGTGSSLPQPSTGHPCLQPHPHPQQALLTFPSRLPPYHGSLSYPLKSPGRVLFGHQGTLAPRNFNQTCPFA